MWIEVLLGIWFLSLMILGCFTASLSNRVLRLEALINTAAPGELDKIGVEGTSVRTPTRWMDDFDSYPDHKPLR